MSSAAGTDVDPTNPSTAEIMDAMAAVGTAYFHDFAAVVSRHGLTSVQAKTLSLLRRPLPMRGLADRLVCDASNVTGIVDRLESRGLVRREPNPNDRRVKNVVATEEGHATIRRIRSEMKTTRAALDALTTDERLALFGLLARLRPAMEAPHA
ncbi:MarR family winged helix-turn-helix transcriptional regulator [Embleya scabrispora]|uniref:MarR family winged helix-turn-helix transcriptional regulator n=1 Tax=Embleya scabrispora TaxID=159449 RepID=UPI00035C89BB|nr:MarR family transcriptional regulator [Embleya scabrispora]